MGTRRKRVTTVSGSLFNDMRGVAALAVDGVLGITNVVERVHATIASTISCVVIPPGLPESASTFAAASNPDMPAPPRLPGLAFIRPSRPQVPCFVMSYSLQ